MFAGRGVVVAVVRERGLSCVSQRSVVVVAGSTNCGCGNDCGVCRPFCLSIIHHKLTGVGALDVADPAKYPIEERRPHEQIDDQPLDCFRLELGSVGTIPAEATAERPVGVVAQHALLVFDILQPVRQVKLDVVVVAARVEILGEATEVMLVRADMDVSTWMRS